MRHRLLYILPLCLTLLTGCEDMFYRQIDFEGGDEPEMLVLTGNLQVSRTPHLRVSHSFFFDRTDKNPAEWVPDADLSLSINGRTYPLSYQDDCTYTDAALPPLQPLDTVEITAVHPRYATATARVVMPARVQSTVLSHELLPTRQMAFRLQLDAYRGNADDIIGIQASCRLKGTRVRSFGAGQKQWTDTVRLTLGTLYSGDILFAEAENASTEGYYGAYGDNSYLYFPASALDGTKQLQFLLDDYQLRWETLDSVEVEELEIVVAACTCSEYRFVQSTRSAYYLNYLPVPTHLPEQETTVMEEIMEMIQQALGDQEPVKVYTDIEGGLGHISGFSFTRHRFEF